MSVTFKGGVGVSMYGIYYDMSQMAYDPSGAQQPASAAPKDNSVSTKWAPWGENNQAPLEMIREIENCGILNSIIDHQARFALGEGLQWAYTRRDNTGKLIIEELCSEPEILDFMKMNNHYFHEFAWMKDQIGFANGVARFSIGNDGKIDLIQRDDITEMRYGKLVDGVIPNIFLSAQWDGSPKEEDKTLLVVPLLDYRNPLADLIRRKNQSNIFAYTFKYPGWGKKYYSYPLWWSNKKWVKIAQSIPEMKAAIYANSMRPKYKITIYQEFWDNLFIGDGPNQKASYGDYSEDQIQSKKNEVYDQIDNYLSGAENAGKAIFADGYIDKVNGKEFKYIDIETIEDTTKNGDYLPDSAAANSEIAFSMRYNPAILGATMPSGPYTNSQGGSSVRESVAMQVITHEPERQNIYSIYRLIRDFNGWDKDFAKPGLQLEPIIPATILTTLDTGAGTKPITLGATPGGNQNPQNNGTN